MNTRLTLVLLLIVAILGGWYYSLQEKDNNGLDQLIKKEGEPEYVGNKMSTSVYDLQGKPQYFAQADEIKRFESTERTEFLKPFIELFAKDSTLKQWKVSADYAEITKDKILNLDGNVKLEALDPTSRLQQITTDKLTVDLNTQDIFTESVVKSVGSGFTTTGVGLKGNLKQQVATLQKDVKSYIEPTIIRQTQE
ncbi:LPS export ABC transporter periplasmic protein LptC [Mannheimia sp. AT1]|uniref:Lipopolysaccharide export system protein LptC n=1 Tax=Mannheimia cairinae TaxID=3025936 RepID=A0ABT5MQL5_9PAST|nr:LPS export ABC transporter periplasmic protein LptC [Mannheimia cairinae]MDD0824476.1 LPS export ABC transporter periplasmic protein LptC [Mannheimia cairinae]MDD0825577.1 LPS export ABC transporter periplasmic protein LptC [Mannheimia cairinae]